MEKARNGRAKKAAWMNKEGGKGARTPNSSRAGENRGRRTIGRQGAKKGNKYDSDLAAGERKGGTGEKKNDSK